MKPTKHPPRTHVAMGIGLAFSIASAGCAFLVDFDYQEGSGGGAAGTGGAAGSGGAVGCIEACGECLASSDQGTGKGKCGEVESTPRVDAGYSMMAPEGIVPPVIRDVVSGNGFVYLVGTFELNLTTTGAGPINNQGYPEGLLSRVDPNAPTEGIAKRLVGCGVDPETNVYGESFEPLILAAAAWDSAPSSAGLVIAGGFGAQDLRLAGVASTNPCVDDSKLVLTKDSTTGVVPFLLKFDEKLSGSLSNDLIAAPAGGVAAYFTALTIVEGQADGPPVVVALGVASGALTYYGNDAPAGGTVEVIGPEGLPGYFLYAADLQRRNSHLQPLGNYGPCGGSDLSDRYYGLDSALVAQSPWPTGSAVVSVGYGMTNGGPECGASGQGVAVGGVALRWDENASDLKLKFDFPVLPLALGADVGSDASIRAMALLPDSGLLAVAGTYSGKLGVQGEPADEASDDGYVAVFRPNVAEASLQPRWVRRIAGEASTGDGSRVEVGGLAAQLRLNETSRLLVTATVPEAGALGPSGGQAIPVEATPSAAWCLPQGPRVLIASLDGQTGEVYGANLLGEAADAKPWGLAASAIATAAPNRAYVAFSAAGSVAVDCGSKNTATGFGSVHLRTFTFE